jgi:hypothetical protein
MEFKGNQGYCYFCLEPPNERKGEIICPTCKWFVCWTCYRKFICVAREKSKIDYRNGPSPCNECEKRIN